MLRIKILPLSFTGTCYGGKAGKKSEEGDGKAEGRSQEGETFRRSEFFTPPPFLLFILSFVLSQSKNSVLTMLCGFTFCP